MNTALRLLLLASLMTPLGGGVAVAKVYGFACVPVGAGTYGFTQMKTGPGKPGQWVVVEDPAAYGGRAIVQRSEDPTDGRFPILALTATVPADVSVATRIKPVSGRVDQAGGLVVRLRDENNYYLVRANALEGNVRFYRVVDGRREQIAGVDISVGRDAWQTLRLDAQGDRFSVSFNDQDLFTAVDASIAGPGKVGFWTKADSVTRFDALDVNPLP